MRDKDPYVRKTAAICVAKLADINMKLAEDQGFIDGLNDLLTDGNPMVVANAVAALAEISEYSERDVFRLSSRSLSKLLPALNDCSEWGQVYILNALADYAPRDAQEAEQACERVTNRLNHANSAVVLAAVKLILNYLEFVSNPDVTRELLRKLSPPLITLISRRPEIQYVALRNINLIIQKQPDILARDIRVFFCKYNDPIYVKMEKLDIMIMLVNEDNLEQVLLELKEYSQEVDVEFVRRAVRAIGRCAIKLESGAQRCVKVLLELIRTKVNYVVQEAVVVLKDCFRRYPNRYEGIISALCENLDSLDESQAKAAMIWIIGEYNDRIENADELLEQFLDLFVDEPSQVQLQLLTAIVKLFLRRPQDTQDMVTRVLNLATEESDNPDLRDRGFVYWRLLSTDPAAAKAVVLAEKPVISNNTANLETGLLNTLLHHVGSLASVYHKPPATFVTKLKGIKRDYVPRDEYDSEGEDGNEGAASNAAPRTGDLMGMQGMVQALPSAAGPAAGAQHLPAPASSGTGNLLDDLSFLNTGSASVVQKRLLLAAPQGGGLQLTGCWQRRQGQIFWDLTFQNMGGAPLSGFAVQFNVNSMGWVPPMGAFNSVPLLAPGAHVDISVPMMGGGQPKDGAFSDALQIAIKHSGGIFYFADQVPFEVLLSEQGALEGNAYLAAWNAVPEQMESMTELQGLQTNPEHMKGKLALARIFFVAQRKVGNEDVLYFSSRTDSGSVILAEISWAIGQTVQLCVRTMDQPLVRLLAATVDRLLRT
jgi:AP-1 complex subunit beta-1